jgi:hypothetical protein
MSWHYNEEFWPGEILTGSQDAPKLIDYIVKTTGLHTTQNKFKDSSKKRLSLKQFSNKWPRNDEW